MLGPRVILLLVSGPDDKMILRPKDIRGHQTHDAENAEDKGQPMNAHKT
jgi:hypothetical protein